MLASLIARTEAGPESTRRHYADKHITVETEAAPYDVPRHRYNKSMICTDISSDSSEYKHPRRRHVTPAQHTQPPVQSKKQFPAVKHRIDTTEQQHTSACVRLNKSIQQSTNDLTFEDELGGRIHRLSEAELQQYLTSAVDPLQFLQKTPSEKHDAKLSQYIQQMQASKHKENIDTTPSYTHTVEQRTVQQYVDEVAALPAIQYTVEPFVAPVADGDKGKNKKRATQNKAALAKTMKATTRQTPLAAV